jgi:hypothetical protein
MCRRITCRVCDQPTWAGCGAHAEQVLADVPRDERCSCSPADRAAARGGSLWARLFGR